MPNTKLLYCPELGVKLRTSGINNYVTKLYDVGQMLNDATQTTALNQPYLSGNIAPTEKYSIKNPNGGSAYLTHTSISFSATDKWSVSFIYNNFNQSSGTYGIVLSDAGPSHVRFQSNSLYIFNNVSEYTFFSGIYNIVGKYAVYTITAPGNGKVNLYLNGLLVATNTFNTGIVFAKLFSGTSATSYGTFVYYSVRDITLSPVQVQDEHNYLRSLFPEIESVKIGTQTWATSNCEMTCTPQGNVIQEMRAATNVEKITNAADRDFSSDTGFWTKGTGWSIANGYAEYIGGSSGAFSKGSLLTATKRYKITLKVDSLSGTAVFNLADFSSHPLADRTIKTGTNSYYLVSTTGGFTIVLPLNLPSDYIKIDSISIEEVGWSDSTNLYNYIYANTTGTSEQKEYAAVKAAAMWCYYNNDPTLGAVYGKLYNWYAVKLLQMDIDYYNAANPTTPWGWRVPIKTDFDVLLAYLGGATIAGGKMKKDGLDYWNTPNSGADNSSGFSALGSGYRVAGGGFGSGFKNASTFWTTTTSVQYPYKVDLIANESVLGYGINSPEDRGFSLRLIKA